jgi:hypothetical protein
MTDPNCVKYTCIASGVASLCLVGGIGMSAGFFRKEWGSIPKHKQNNID